MTKLAETFQIQPGCITKHPDADRLDVVDVYGDGRTFALVKRGDFVEGEIAVFLPAIADPMVDTTNPVFAFLASDAKKDGFARIKVKKLRGVESRGLVIKTLETVVDLDVSEALGVKKYEKPEVKEGHESGPDRLIPGTYDVEGVGKYHRLLIPGEEVVLTEKIHGSNISFYWVDGALRVRSRNFWKALVAIQNGELSQWWEAAERCEIETGYAEHPEFQHLAFYGEVYGRNVQDMPYGLTDRRFILFDIWDTTARQWLSFDERVKIAEVLDLRTVPVLYRGPWLTVEVEGTDGEGNPTVKHRPHPDMYAFAEGNSVEAERNGGVNVREGYVVEPVNARHDMRIGRVKLKWVGTGYSTRKGS